MNDIFWARETEIETDSETNPILAARTKRESSLLEEEEVCNPLG